MKGLYFLFLSIFILRVAFCAFPYDTELINWYRVMSTQTATAQFAFWRLMIFFVEGSLIYAMMAICFHAGRPSERARCYKMAKLLLWIQGWYILEYCIHYTSVWITWEQLGFIGNARSGLSSHIITMSIFAYYGWPD